MASTVAASNSNCTSREMQCISACIGPKLQAAEEYGLHLKSNYSPWFKVRKERQTLSARASSSSKCCSSRSCDNRSCKSGRSSSACASLALHSFPAAPLASQNAAAWALLPVSTAGVPATAVAPSDGTTHTSTVYLCRGEGWYATSGHGDDGAEAESASSWLLVSGIVSSGCALTGLAGSGLGDLQNSMLSLSQGILLFSRHMALRLVGVSCNTRSGHSHELQHDICNTVGLQCNQLTLQAEPGRCSCHYELASSMSLYDNDDIRRVCHTCNLPRRKSPSWD